MNSSYFKLKAPWDKNLSFEEVMKMNTNSLQKNRALCKAQIWTLRASFESRILGSILFPRTNKMSQEEYDIV